MTNGRFDHIDDGPFMGAVRELWGWLRARPRLLWGGIAGLVALIVAGRLATTRWNPTRSPW